MRVTNARLDGALQRYIRALRINGLEKYSNVDLVRASKADGTPYRLAHRVVMPLFIGSVDGSIGWTGKEAMNTLNSIARALEDLDMIREDRS